MIENDGRFLTVFKPKTDRESMLINIKILQISTNPCKVEKKAHFLTYELGGLIG